MLVGSAFVTEFNSKNEQGEQYTIFLSKQNIKRENRTRNRRCIHVPVVAGKLAPFAEDDALHSDAELYGWLREADGDDTPRREKHQEQQRKLKREGEQPEPISHHLGPLKRKQKSGQFEMNHGNTKANIYIYRPGWFELIKVYKQIMCAQIDVLKQCWSQLTHAWRCWGLGSWRGSLGSDHLILPGDVIGVSVNNRSSSSSHIIQKKDLMKNNVIRIYIKNNCILVNI